MEITDLNVAFDEIAEDEIVEIKLNQDKFS